jgi:hypothetical protein
MTLTTVHCERCGAVVSVVTAKAQYAYLTTGRCVACRVGARPGFISMTENIKGEYAKKRETVTDEYRRIGAL